MFKTVDYPVDPAPPSFPVELDTDYEMFLLL